MKDIEVCFVVCVRERYRAESRQAPDVLEILPPGKMYTNVMMMPLY